ncbi:MAG: hypothetical protein J7K88_06230 [Candidatus Fermentibacteraceae bacterium]|nr:hypothetical protein [Candidatus Fermentibacteraceae bacterium]
MVAKLLLPGWFLGLLVVIAGCTNLTEYDMAYMAGLYVISAGDFTVIETIPDIEGARILLLYPGNIFVVSTEGVIYRYDSETMELVDQNQIGSPSAAGYSDAVFCTVKNTAYIIGSYGEILELSLPECVLVDQFSVCQSPVMLALGAGASYLFVADGPSNRVYQVKVNGNKTGDNVSIYYTIRCMAPFQNPDSMLVSTVEDLNLVSVLSATNLRSVLLAGGRPFSALVAVPDDTVFIGVNGNSIGVFDAIGTGLPPWPTFEKTVWFAGTPLCLAVANDWQHAYLLVYMAGVNSSRLISYNYSSGHIDRELDIPGYPLDLEVLGGEAVYVLTTK